MTRRPRAFEPVGEGVVVDVAPEIVERPVVPSATARKDGRWPLGSLLGGAVVGLLGLWFVTAVERFILDLLEREPLLGRAAAVLAGVALLAAAGLMVREVRAVLRAASIDELRSRAAAALETDSRSKARAVIVGLTALYRDRPETAEGRGRLAAAEGDVIDGRDMVRLAERELLPALDASAAAAVTMAAKRVSIATAVAPRAVLDVVIVAVQALGLVREIAAVYGARPGTAGFLRILRAVFAHLALTGGIAVGDSFVQQLLGHGLAARISARLGEGVLNGLLTARVGLAAMDVCRPLPFDALKRPGLREVAGALFDGAADPEAR